MAKKAVCESHIGIFQTWDRIAQRDTPSGYEILWQCPKCKEKKVVPYTKGRYPEFVPASFHTQRQAYAKSMVQPWRDGVASQEFIEAYPDQAKNLFSDRDRKKAKNVWGDTLPSNWKKSH